MERNRASARVRRQRKKDMAELYEKEVARLERGIRTLKTHVWGSGDAAAADLAEALGGSYPGGARVLSCCVCNRCEYPCAELSKLHA